MSRFQLEISFIKQKLSEVISQGSSGSVVKDAGLGMEVPGSNSGELFFSTFFTHLFYPAVTVLLEYLDPEILHMLSFCFITLSL